MQTAFDQIVAAYPDHAHRILDLSIQQHNDLRKVFAYSKPRRALSSAFVWEESSEGHEYWSRLAGWM